jgi:hypothetical protein
VHIVQKAAPGRGALVKAEKVAKQKAHVGYIEAMLQAGNLPGVLGDLTHRLNLWGMYQIADTVVKLLPVLVFQRHDSLSPVTNAWRFAHEPSLYHKNLQNAPDNSPQMRLFLFVDTWPA